MSNLLVFAGTTEGRELLEALSRGIGGSGLTVSACVATDYGKELLPEGLDHIQVQAGRLTEAEMVLLMKEKQFDYVIDTTHPYARLASENIKAACKIAGCEYIRVLRSKSILKQAEKNKDRMESAENHNLDTDSNCLFFDNHEAVAEYLNQTTGNVLLTVGSKELSKYTKVKDYQSRIFPRVLPMVEVVESCYVLGFPGKQLICMQGPFSEELNIALIKQINAKFIISKDSGETGGFPEKYQAARKTGAVMLVIGRDWEEEGQPLEELMLFLESKYQITNLRPVQEPDKNQKTEKSKEPGQWFPLFTNISGKTILVVGAGKIAKRRIETLLQFDCRLKVVAKEVLPEVRNYGEEEKLELQIRAFESSDLENVDYVLAATSSKALNQGIAEQCKEKKIPVNAADDKDLSDFYFPGIIRTGGVTVGVTADGKNHALAKEATKEIAECLNRKIQEDGTIGSKND